MLWTVRSEFSEWLEKDLLQNFCIICWHCWRKFNRIALVLDWVFQISFQSASFKLTEFTLLGASCLLFLILWNPLPSVPLCVYKFEKIWFQYDSITVARVIMCVIPVKRLIWPGSQLVMLIDTPGYSIVTPAIIPQTAWKTRPASLPQDLLLWMDMKGSEICAVKLMAFYIA